MNRESPKRLNMSGLLYAFIIFFGGSQMCAAMSNNSIEEPKKEIEVNSKFKKYEVSGESEMTWSSKPLREKGELSVKEAFILLEGGDLAGGTIKINSSKFGKASLVIVDSLLGKGGVYNCKGVLEMNGEKKELFFDVNLVSVKKGFELHSQIAFAQEDFKLKLYEKSKKAYDDVIFNININVFEK